MKTLIIALAASAAFAGPALAQTQGQPGQPPGQSMPQAGQPSQAEGQVMVNDLTQDQIRQLQQALKDKGHYTGQIDGKWGPETAEAMSKFRSEKGGTAGQGMQAQDRIDRESLTALGLDPAQFGRMGPNDQVAPGAPPSGSPGTSPDSGSPGSPGAPGGPSAPGGQNR